MKPARTSGAKVFSSFDDFALAFPIRRDDRNRRRLYLLRPVESFSPWDAYHYIQYTRSGTTFFEPEDVWGLKRLRVLVRDGCRPRPIAALYSHIPTEDGFWLVPFLDVDGAWCSEQVYHLAEYYDSRWQLLYSRLGPLPKSAS